MSSSSVASIHITKLAAANRQLCAAIRMFFSGEDELAIHTVASASYRLICDLKEQRGRNEVGDHYLNLVFYSVRDYRRGTLPSDLAKDPKTMKLIRKWAERLPITETSKYEDISTSVSPDVAKEFWDKRNKVSNFLKHADLDSDAHISLEEVDNFILIMQTLASYSDISGGDLPAEGYVFYVYHSVECGMTEGLPTTLSKIAEDLERLSQDERLKSCSMLINGMKEEWGEA